MKTLITNSKLDVLLKRFAKNEAVPNPDDCEWNKQTRLEQVDKWLENPTGCPFVSHCPNSSSCTVKASPHVGGIDLPTRGMTGTGTGNIAISGKYGQGKTTLALQIASACAEQGGVAIYFSLESRDVHLQNRYINDPRRVKTIVWDGDAFDPKPLANLIKATPTGTGILIFLKIKDKTAKNVPCDYFEEIKKLSNLKNKWKLPAFERIKMIVFDSLNESCDYNRDRRWLHLITSWLEENRIIGLFPLEDRSDESEAAARFVGDVKYTVDCVINLSITKYGDYEQACIQVEKSRTAKHVLGKHIYKIKQFDEGKAPIHIAKRYLDVFPSLHSVFTTLPVPKMIAGAKHYTNLLGDSVFDEILPQSMTGNKFKNDKHPRAVQVLTLTGKLGLYKSDIAINALLYGLLDGQNGLIIRLNDNETFMTSGVRLNEHLWKKYNASEVEFMEMPNLPGGSKSIPNKYVLKCWEVIEKDGNGNPKPKRYKEDQDPKLYEIVFAKGAIQPEEWLALLMDVIEKEKIKRAALVDLKSIGVSYKFLVSNETSGDMFLPTFTQVMKSKGVDLIYAASESEIPASRQETLRARNLANATIVFEKDDGVKLSGTFDIIQNQSHSIRLKRNVEGRIKVSGIEHNLPTFAIG